MAIFVFSTINTTRNFAVLIKNPKFAVMLGGLMYVDHAGPDERTNRRAAFDNEPITLTRRVPTKGIALSLSEKLTC